MDAMPDLDWRRTIHPLFRAAGIRQVAYVPDAGHTALIEACHADPSMRAIVLTNEAEGMGVLAGAWLGGQRGVLLMQSSGVGNCVNALSLTQICRFPFLTLVTMRGEWGEFNSWQVPMGQGTEAALKGHPSAMFFGYTFCPDVCPTTLFEMTAWLDTLGPDADRLKVYFVTVDPERDTAEAVGAYVGAFHSRFVGLTGTPEQIAQATKVYRVFAQKAPLKDTDGKETGEYTVEHSGMIFFMSPEGRYLTHFSNGATAADMAAYIRREAGA